jgi:S-(hydroxymethyl)mycothiol dehydrogenase
VSPDSDPAVVGLLGCGVMAGLGAAMNTGGVVRCESVAVIGCGGVGDAALADARLAGATTIIAIDRVSRKLD